jgi:hypothetical protein
MIEDPNSMEIGSIREYTKDRLRKDGYKLLLKAIETVKLAESYERKNHLALDFTHNYILEVRLKNDENSKIWRSRYAERPSKILISALKVSIENEWFKKPVSKYDFKIRVSNECSKASSSNVNFFLNRKSTRRMFEVDDMTDTVKLLFIPKEIIGVEELSQKD